MARTSPAVASLEGIQQWVIPPKANSAFVAAMEDVLAVYTRPARSRLSAGAKARPEIEISNASKSLAQSGGNAKAVMSEGISRSEVEAAGQPACEKSPVPNAPRSNENLCDISTRFSK